VGVAGGGAMRAGGDVDGLCCVGRACRSWRCPARGTGAVRAEAICTAAKAGGAVDARNRAASAAAAGRRSGDAEAGASRTNADGMTRASGSTNTEDGEAGPEGGKAGPEGGDADAKGTGCGSSTEGGPASERAKRNDGGGASDASAPLRRRWRCGGRGGRCLAQTPVSWLARGRVTQGQRGIPVPGAGRAR